MVFTHSAIQPDYKTPIYLWDKVQQVLGTIDLDPCGSSFPSPSKVSITEVQDGLATDWAHIFGDTPFSVYINPPGGSSGDTQNYKAFWRQLMAYHQAGCISHAIFLGFNVAQIHTLQDDDHHPLSFPTCIMRKRIKFIDPVTDTEAKSPKYNNFVSYIPGTIDRTDEFVNVFSDLGSIVCAI